MKLQLALDDISLTEALALVDAVRTHIDIVEIGTPFIISEGLAPVKAMKARFPDLEVFADLKIMDAGAFEARLAFAAGADYVTVLAVTDIATIRGCLETAAGYGKTVVADMICVDDMAARIAELEAVGVMALAVHTGVDQQAAGRTPLDELKLMKVHSRSSRIFVAGGITRDTLAHYFELGADVAIVGSGICKAADPVQEAKAFRRMINELANTGRT
jgi:3-hexulose-6-phosphate synthase